MVFFGILENTLRLLKSGFSLLIKQFLSPDMSFHFIFPLFFYVFIVEDSAVSIRQRNHIKSIIMFYQTLNFRYSRYIIIIFYIDF